jgi:hypothetical protein
MGGRTPETCGAVNKRQDNKLKKLLPLVGDLFELQISHFLFCFSGLVWHNVKRLVKI